MQFIRVSAHTPAWLLAAALLAQAGVSPAARAQAPSPATRLARTVNAASYRAHLEFLASDDLEGRGTGTRGGRLAAHYIATQFQRLGLEPAGDSGFYYRVPIIGLTPDPTLKTTGPAARNLSYRDDYVVWSMRDEPQVNLSASAVFVGYGIVAPELNWNDYAGIDAHGKIVVCLVNDPGLRDSTLFRGRILTYYGRWTYKIEEAARQGAAGILMIHTDESATYPWDAVRSSWSGEQVRTERPATSLLLAGWIRDSTAAELFRQDGLDLEQAMRQANVPGFRPVNLPFGFEAGIRSEIRRSVTYNVVGRLPGRGRLARQAVMIGGHYDHFGIRTPVNGDSIYNGAEDNASGTAAVIAAAEAFVQSGVAHQRSILFIGYGAEEAGLLGSEAFAERPTVPLRDIAAVLNLDIMNMYGRTRDVAALGVDQSSLGRVFTRAAAVEGLKVTTNQDALHRGAFFRSDHFPFVRAGIPALSLENGTVVLNRPPGWGEQKREEYTATRYHKPQDEVLPWFSMDGVVQQLRVVLRTALTVANDPALPSWNPGSEFQAAGEARLRQ